MRIDTTSTAVTVMIAVGVSVTLWWWQHHKQQQNAASGGRNDDDDSSSSSTDETHTKKAASDAPVSTSRSKTTPSQRNTMTVKAISLGTDKTIFPANFEDPNTPVFPDSHPTWHKPPPISPPDNNTANTTTTESPTKEKQPPSHSKEEEEDLKDLQKETFSVKDIPDFTMMLDDDDDDGDMF